ncbi:hypothetical protein SAMN05428959_1011134 [Duganella sp. CF517]|uniref:DUF7940 domain-containing protein n=1 Tax=Duganella sp. CF517 TaxID=1881038 RepID=UPI0008C1B2A4|nr:hypothetical protein [Duganella sp. CF517]SEN31369.1 hypothetical protein SAMN05428959_1011134 [Duganella sp. CF517]
MKIKLIGDWRAVLKRAWSVKFNVLAALLGAAEMVVLFYQPASIRPGVFAGIDGGVSLAAALARLVAQNELSGGKNGNS